MKFKLIQLIIFLGILVPIVLLMDHLIVPTMSVMKVRKEGQFYVRHSRGGDVIINYLKCTDNSEIRVLDKAFNEIPNGHQFIIEKTFILGIAKEVRWYEEIDIKKEFVPGYPIQKFIIIISILLIIFWSLILFNRLAIPNYYLLILFGVQTTFIIFYIFLSWVT